MHYIWRRYISSFMMFIQTVYPTNEIFFTVVRFVRNTDLTFCEHATNIETTLETHHQQRETMEGIIEPLFLDISAAELATHHTVPLPFRNPPGPLTPHEISYIQAITARKFGEAIYHRYHFDSRAVDGFIPSENITVLEDITNDAVGYAGDDAQQFYETCRIPQTTSELDGMKYVVDAICSVQPPDRVDMERADVAALEVFAAAADDILDYREGGTADDRVPCLGEEERVFNEVIRGLMPSFWAVVGGRVSQVPTTTKHGIFTAAINGFD
jgi:hypothetical protein